MVALLRSAYLRLARGRALSFSTRAGSSVPPFGQLSPHKDCSTPNSIAYMKADLSESIALIGQDSLIAVAECCLVIGQVKAQSRPRSDRVPEQSREKEISVLPTSNARHHKRRSASSVSNLWSPQLASILLPATSIGRLGQQINDLDKLSAVSKVDLCKGLIIGICPPPPTKMVVHDFDKKVS
ncbi:hypothetical protein H4Q26_017889 [Puccinia striiformis f. sp. tritici PST-130]|nr:hypothetical protein H4Q26_017889 [Puccinia striiformis f. sp. tritici PST-130]